MATQILIALVTVLLLLSPLPRKDSNPQRLYLPTGQEASLTGTITFEGKVPPQRVIDMSADPICMQRNPKGMTEDVVTTGDKLQNAIVYFKSGEPLTRHTFEQSEEPAVLEHKDCFYRPHVLGIRVNQPLRIENNDSTQHNTHPVPKLNPEWNHSQPPGWAPLTKSFSIPEIIPIKDNQHPWEKAYVGVFSHPFFAISDVYGRFEIRGIPPGTYTLTVWHERLGQQELEMTLVPYEVRSMDFMFGRESR